MTDMELIRKAYTDMYDAMIRKDREGLGRVLDDGFVLIPMTGMRQQKDEFIRCVMDGTLNYYSAVHENMSVGIRGDEAVLTGQSYVQAAVFGGSKSRWHLQQKCCVKKTEDGWKITRSVAGTY